LRTSGTVDDIFAPHNSRAFCSPPGQQMVESVALLGL
jgi:hypothetical protein